MIRKLKNKRQENGDMKKMIIWLLAAALLLVPFGMSAEAENQAEEFEYGDYIYHKLEDGSALIWTYLGEDEAVVIPEELDGCPVMAVGPAFMGNRQIREVTMPDTVTELCEGAFCGCARLQEIRLSENLQAVKDRTFLGCSALKSVRVPDSVTLIGKNAFGSCSRLKQAELSAGLTEIGPWAFNECVRLNELIIPEGVTVIRMYAFRCCSALTELIIPATVTTLEEELLYECNNLKLVVCPGSVTEIGGGALGWGERIVVIDRDSAAEQYCINHGIEFVWSDEYQGNGEQDAGR